MKPQGDIRCSARPKTSPMRNRLPQMSARTAQCVSILLLLFLCACANVSWAQEVGNLSRGVVKIVVTYQDGKRHGTGFILRLASDKVHIVTAAHVVQGARDIQVELFARRNRPLPAKIIGMEEDEDLKGVAALLVEGDIPQGLARLELDVHDPVYAGDPIATIGFPVGGAPWSISKGEVVGRYRKSIVFSGPIEEGASGGPLIKEGKVVGVVSETKKPFTYATPAAITRYVLDGWGIPNARREAQAQMLAAESETVRRKSLEPDPEDERYYWPDLMKPKGRDDLAKLSVLLALESQRRSPSPEGQEALRAALGLFNRPIADMTSTVAVAFNPDGESLLVAGSETARTWDIATAKETARFSYGKDYGTDLLTSAISPDARFLAIGTKMGTAKVWDSISGQELASMQHDRAVRSVAFGSDGRFLVTISGQLTMGARTLVHLWDIATGRERWRLRAEGRWDSITLDPEGTYLVARTSNSRQPGIVSVGEMESGTEVWQKTFERSPVYGIAISTDGLRLAAISRSGFYVWTTADGQELVRLLIDSSGIAPPAFSLDGRYLATPQAFGVSIWNLSGGVPHLRMLPGDHTARVWHDRHNRVTAVVFSPDGKYLATGGANATAHLWDLPAGKELARMQHWDPHGGPVTDLAFSPDGAYLVTRTRDGRAMLWRLFLEDLVAEACARLDRNLTPHEWRTYMGDEPYRGTCKNLP